VAAHISSEVKRTVNNLKLSAFEAVRLVVGTTSHHM